MEKQERETPPLFRGAKFAFLLVSVALWALGVGCGSRAPTPAFTLEPTVPPQFITVIDDEKTFSISYPNDWLVRESVRPARETEVDRSQPKARFLFAAGAPGQQGVFDPDVRVTTFPVGLYEASMVDQVAKQHVASIKGLSPLSQRKAIVGGREAVIIDSEGKAFGLELQRVLLFVLDEKQVWNVTCGTSVERFPPVQETCNQVVRSFKILN